MWLDELIKFVRDPVSNATSFGEATLRYHVLNLTPNVVVNSISIMTN
jgi:hypothetical protein